MELSNVMCWFWISKVPEVGVKGINKLLESFGSVEKVFYASEADLIKSACITQQQVSCLIKSRNKDKIIEEYNNLKEKDIYFVTKEDEIFPAKLREIYDSPYFLYYKGKLPAEDKPSVAIIGARNCTNYGKEITMYLSTELAKHQVQVISGLARGIDSYAHQGALDGGGDTFGVVGCGVDICYPKENRRIYDRILNKGGVISEYPIGTVPLPFHFPMRNRLIAGLCDVILVVEARESSGTFITVDRGLEQGKDILAIPGRIGDSLSSGCNRLIQNGAKLVRNVEDILEELNLKYDKNLEISIKKCKEMYNPTTTKKEQNNKNNLDVIKNCKIILERDEKIVYDRLSLEPKHLEILLHETNLSHQQLTIALMSLELKNLITQWISNYYVRNV
ncbi:DNA-processing protein DprA [Clostridium sp. Marseille-P299]|uniref:DNA-processing protein DprA n=1 Tax=Clostridium sp. Marseille-P299 TaxID=1805477 RepID=UPI00082CDA72|nr:DNA-processing protein DprA [Clostridium sp. Marseille-P299]